MNLKTIFLALLLALPCVMCSSDLDEDVTTTPHEVEQGEDENGDGEPDDEDQDPDDNQGTTPDPEDDDNTTAEDISDYFWAEEYAEITDQASEVSVDIVADYAAPTDGVSDASPALLSAISFVAEQGGGVVNIPYGEYSLREIVLKNGVKIRIAAGTTIHPRYIDSSRFTLFEFGDDSANPVSDVEVTGVGGRFNIVLVEQPDNAKAIRVFRFSAVSDFRVSNVHIEDVRTELPLLAFSPTDMDSSIMGPTNGVITHISATNCHYGYGIVQAQCAIDCHYEKLSGEGGVTLRFETGESTMNDEQWGGVYGVTGKYIYGKNGNAAAMISPHSKHNGTAKVENIISHSCGIGVRIDEGYVASGQSNPDLTDGTYEEAVVRNVYAEYGQTAQVKTKHLKYMADELLDLVPDPDENSICEPSPAVCAVLNVANYPNLVENVVAVGFLTADIVTE